MSRSHLRRGVAASLVLVAVPLTLGSGTSDAAHRTKTIIVKDIAFHPKTLIVARGTTVTWKFEDPETEHNVTAYGHTFKGSGDKREGSSYSVRFTRKGTYRYHCTIHIGMTGTVKVR